MSSSKAAELRPVHTGQGQGPEKRGRFEVWPEQVISHADWLALSKAPTGYVDQVKQSAGLEVRPANTRSARSAASVSRPGEADMLAPGSPAAAAGLGVAPAGGLVAVGGPDGAQVMVKQYNAALSALQTLRGSLLGMGRSMGVSIVETTTGSSSSSGSGGAGMAGGAGDAVGVFNGTALAAGSAESRLRDRDGAYETVPRPRGAGAGVGVGVGVGADDRGEGEAALGMGLGHLPSGAAAPTSPASAMHPSASFYGSTPGLGSYPPLARTLSTLSAGTTASALGGGSDWGEVGQLPRSATAAGVGAAGTPGAAGTAAGFAGSAASEAERLRADMEALRAAKTKLLQENKALQEKLEKTVNDLTVSQQKLKRHGL